MSQSTRKAGTGDRAERGTRSYGSTVARVGLLGGLLAILVAAPAGATPSGGAATAAATAPRAAAGKRQIAAGSTHQARRVAAPAKASAVFLVRVIEASKGPSPRMDPRLAAMQREFRPFLGQYNQFTLIRDQTLRLNLNQAGNVALPTGKRFGLTMLGFTTGKVRRIRYEVQMPRTRMKRSVAPGTRTLDVIRNGAKLTIISTTVR